MAILLDETHDVGRRSWVASANGHGDSPIQNLPLGIFSVKGDAPRGGVAIGNEVFDLKAACEAKLLSGEAEKAARAASAPTLNELMALGAGPRAALRRQLSALMAEGTAESARARPLAARLLHKAGDCTLHLPAKIGAFTDFFAGIIHAENGGRRRGANPPLSPNYKYVPVAYHSRASTVRPTGVPVRRPGGQRVVDGGKLPTFGPCLKMDFELELGIWIGNGNAWGDPIPVVEAGEHIYGYCMLNDWSARDIQRWESAPLGPFLSKNFGTTVSPWIITPEALAPFRVAQPARPGGDPRPLDYLWDDADQRDGALDLEIEALIHTAGMRERGMPPQRISVSNTRHLYWTVAQMVAHHTCGGCSLEAGDLLGSGTISGPTPENYGSISELSFDGTRDITLASGEIRRWVEDGDDIILRAHGRREGYAAIGFGDCCGRIVTPTTPALRATPPRAGGE
jgi:fumarylacetoacetase